MELPFIKINNPPLRFLIDTGSSHSFINPEIARKYFSKYIEKEQFSVTTSLQTSHHTECCNIPIFPYFNFPNKNLKIKYYLYKFHEYFDGLIGIDLIKYLKGRLDFNNDRLITENVSIPIYYNKTKKTICEEKIDPQTRKLIKIPVNVLNGEILVPPIQIQNCKSEECITKAKNNLAIIEMTNLSSKPVILNFTQPIQVERFDKTNFKIYNMEIDNYENKKRLNFNNIRTEHLNNEERSQLLKLCGEYSNIFYKENTDLTFTHNVKHKIRTVDEDPIYTRSYRYPFIHKPEIEKQISDMLKQKIIQASDSPWSSPVWLVPKKMDATQEKKWRLVIDFRKLNAKTTDDKYPIPNITDILDKLGRCQYFTTLDLKNGFYQIEMDPKDIKKTAFSVEGGHYEFLRMPMGLKNAPSTFQRTMDVVLQGLQNKICLVYLDDIIVFSTSLQEHLVRLKQVFQRLLEANFKIQLDKSEFLKKEVSYLGHVVTSDGIKPNPDKIAAIKSYPLPTTTKEIKSFLGLLGYYRRFIKNFAHITKPLTDCLKKHAKIIHDERFKNCFELCKNLLMNEPILQFPDFNEKFNLTTDASNLALGAVLSQGPISKDKPVAYASRTLSDHEKNYSTIEKELLAIYWATKHFRRYLYG